MAEKGIPILGYRGLPTEPFAAMSPWARITQSKFGLYCIGLGVGGYVAMIAAETSAGDVDSLSVVFGCSLVGILLFLPVLVIPAGIVRAMSSKSANESDAQISTATGPAATIAFFPAAQLLGCKFLSVFNDDMHYPGRISPFHFLVPWLALGLACTILLRKAPRLGTKKSHWCAAGVAAPLALFATFEGISFLNWSATGGRDTDPSEPILWTILLTAGIAIGLFAVPILVAMSYHRQPDYV